MNRNRIAVSLFLLVSLALVSSSTATTPTQAGAVPAFSDVRGDGVWPTAIRQLAGAGYVRGRAPGRFAPNAAVTQAEMAVLLVRAARGPAFDVPAADGAWWQGWAAEAEREGLMAYPSNPDAPATRAQMATLMWLAMDQTP